MERGFHRLGRCAERRRRAVTSIWRHDWGRCRRQRRRRKADGYGAKVWTVVVHHPRPQGLASVAALDARGSLGTGRTKGVTRLRRQWRRSGRGLVARWTGARRRGASHGEGTVRARTQGGCYHVGGGRAHH
ncbi:proteoglycan 4-like [Iris pallida]|uniref:Proteoglycan 4-like n=1 Tax=Iris pallida TaxID=29817 RepID=A0AAX6HNZ8_IRIPA|nr:proteoglycan 4-like [Iris pallida]